MASIDKPGIYTMREDAYHADPCPAPSVSSSIARTLLGKTPRHAWTEHARLNRAFTPETRQEFDLGSASHSYMLGDDRRMRVIQADSYRTNAAKAARDAAYEAGEIPIRTDQLTEVQAMVAEGRRQIAAHREAAYLFGPTGKAEQTVIWQEKNGVWCRARLDWLQNDHELVADYKSTGESANPETWQRTAYNMLLDVQAAWYRRGVKAVTGKLPRFQFAVQEVKPPYALSVIELTPAALDMAEERVEEAIDLWGKCLAADRWPGYPAVVCHIDPPGYEVARHEERKGRAHIARMTYGKDILDLANDWQRPHGAAQ